jgi:hypothetical protein
MKKAAIFFAIALALNFIWPAFNAQAAGATLLLSPSVGTYIIGSSFTIKVTVNSGGGTGINAAEGALSFDPAYLSVATISNNDSIFELWTSKPAYSNPKGTISFGGGLPSAYKGSAGAIFTVTFTAKKIGTTNVNFSSGVILAADGKGTNVFSGFGNGSYVIKEKTEPAETKPAEEEKPAEPEGPKGILPPAPEVTSRTHPEENKWYTNNQPEFTWKLLTDITAMSYEITATSTDEPDLKSDGVVESKNFTDIKDGEWYFHIKFQNKNGWGKSSHRKFQVDATAPVLSDVYMDHEGDPTNPSPLLRFSSLDEASGIERYSIVLNDTPHEIKSENWQTDRYRFPPLLPGEYKLDLAAYDRAGNSASTTLHFAVEALKPPIISDIAKVLTTKEELVIRGTSFYPLVTIKIYLAREGGEPVELSATTDEQGDWNYFHQKGLDKGIYEVWAKVIDNRGAQSSNSAKHVLTVIKPSIIDTYGWLIILVLLAIIILELIYIIYLRRTFAAERERIKREVEEARRRLFEIFTALREEVDELMELADKKSGLSESERRVKEKLQEALNISQEFLDKEIEDVEKEIAVPKKEAQK